MAVFVAVEVDDDPIGLPARFLDPAQILFEVGPVALARNLEAVATNEPLVQQRQFFFALDRNFRPAEKVRALPNAFLLETEFAAHALELFEHGAVDRIGVLEAGRVDAGAAADVRPLRAGAVPGAEGGRRGKNGD